MSVYWIGRTKIFDRNPIAEYSRLTQLAVAKHPRRTLAWSGEFREIEGESIYDRYVIHEYNSMEEALAFYNSDEYQQAVPLRMAASRGHSNLVLLEGLSSSTARLKA